MAMSDNRTTELLPCPFCGGEAKIIGSDDWLQPICRNHACPCDWTDWYTTKAEAIAAWNARAEMDYEDALILLDELGVSERTCECVAEYAKSPFDGKTIVLHRCSECRELMRPHMHYCPNCGCKVVNA